MPSYRVAFQNCTNLFPTGVVSRGPADVAVKINAVAHSLLGTVGRPDILALCEVYSGDLVERLLNQMEMPDHEVLFRPSLKQDETGLAICYDRNQFRQVSPDVSDVDRRGSTRRPRWLAALFEAQTGSRGAFWLVANHWKSQMGGQVATEPDRQESAYLLGDFFMSEARRQTEAMLLIGDFNCEPGDRPFCESQRQMVEGKPNALRGTRERWPVLRDRNRLAYFYNFMWRFLPEPATLKETLAPGYVPDPTYLMGSHGPALNGTAEGGWLMFDQVMATKRLLRGGPITIDERSVRLHMPLDGACDHAAVSVELKN